MTVHNISINLYNSQTQQFFYFYFILLLSINLYNSQPNKIFESEPIIYGIKIF